VEEELIALLVKHWGYFKVHQIGSHVILQTQDPSPPRIAIHEVLKIGTLNAILSSVATHKKMPKDAVLRDL
jgi:predicted RNA binding protein YcfA (HicA-like mRNA interferase family)